MVRLNIYVATTALPVRGLSAGRMNHLLYINPNVLYFHSIPFIALLYFHVSNCICSRSHSHKPFSPSAYVQPIMYTREGVRVCARAHTRHSGGSNPSTFTFSLRPNLRPVLQRRGLLPASRQFNHTYSTTPFSFPFHTASIPLWLHNSPLRAV